MRKHTRKSLPKLERLLIDTDVNPVVLSYLEAVGFDVMWARKAKVNIHSDRALVAFARHYHRIFVCHDRHRDVKRETRVQICQEIYEKGGQVIQVAGSPAQPELATLGKILIHRAKWLDFFRDNDGIVTVSDASHITPTTRANLIHQVQAIFEHPSIPTINPKAPRKKKARLKPKIISAQQLALEQGTQDNAQGVTDVRK